MPTPGRLWTKIFQKTNWKEWTTSVITGSGKDLVRSHVKVELLAVIIKIVQKKSKRSNNQNNKFTFEKLYTFNGLLRGIVNWIAVEFMIFSNNWETYHHCEWRNFQNSAAPMNVTRKHLTFRPGYWSNLVLQNVCSTTYHLLIHMKHLTCQIFQQLFLFSIKLNFLLSAGINKVNYKGPIRSDEGLTLRNVSFITRYGGQFTFST